MELGNIVKSIRDIMRKDAGIDGDAQRITQMTWMIFLKVFDDMEKEHEAEDGYKSPLPEEIRWRNWAEDPEGITGDELLDFVNEKVFKTLKSLEIEENDDPKKFVVKQVFEDTYNYMKDGILMRQVINKINEIDFTSSHDRHLFNDLYETILRELQSAGSAGEFYTPRPVTQFIVDMVDPQLGEKVLDPACGTGGFLTCALNNMRKKVKSVEDWENLRKNLLGVEKKPLPYLLCTTNFILHDIEVPKIKHDNSLTKNVREIEADDKVDAIVTNPPFGGQEVKEIQANFPQSLRSSETADLFLVLIMYMLRDKGKAGIVLPDGSLFGEGVKTRIKEKLLNEFNLHTIIRLPNGVFNPYTGIRTNLLFFTKGEPTKEVWYFEHPLPEDRNGKQYTKTQPIQYKEFELEKEWWNDRENPKFKDYCWKVSIDEIKNKNYNLDINNPNKKEEGEDLSKEEIIDKIESNLDKSKELLNEIKEG